MMLATMSKHYDSFREENKRIRDISENPAPIALSRKLNDMEFDQSPLSVSMSRNTESGLFLGKQIDDTGAHTSVGHEDGSIVQEMPAPTAANGFTIPKSMGFDTNIRFLYESELSTPSKGKKLKGLYSLQVDVGETASVFDVRAIVLSESDRQQGYKGNAIHKVGVIVPKSCGSL